MLEPGVQSPRLLKRDFTRAAGKDVRGPESYIGVPN